MQPGPSALDAASVIISLWAVFYFLQHNEGGEMHSSVSLPQTQKCSAQQSSDSWASNENCKRPHFLASLSPLDLR